MDEGVAAAIFTAAIQERRASELLEALWDGKGCTVDLFTGKLLIMDMETGKLVKQ